MDAATAKMVADRAKQFFEEVGFEPKASDLRVEEIRQSDDKLHWIVTLGFSRPVTSHSPQAKLAKMLRGGLGEEVPYERAFKQITLSADDLEVTELAIRE